MTDDKLSLLTECRLSSPPLLMLLLRLCCKSWKTSFRVFGNGSRYFLGSNRSTNVVRTLRATLRRLTRVVDQTSFAVLEAEMLSSSKI